MNNANKDKLSEISFFIKKGQYKQAEEKAAELVNKNPNNLVYQNFLSITLASQKKFKESKNILKKIIHTKPNYLDAYINLGNIYLDLNQLEKSA